MENISSLAFVKPVKMVFSVLITESLHLFISFQKSEQDMVFEQGEIWIELQTGQVFEDTAPEKASIVSYVS